MPAIRGKIIPSSKKPKKFVDWEHRKRFSMKFQSKNFAKLRLLGDISPHQPYRQELIDQARYGNKSAQKLLREMGVRGLWNPKIKEMVRF